MAGLYLLIVHRDAIGIQRVLVAPVQPGDRCAPLALYHQGAAGGRHLLGAHQFPRNQGVPAPQLLVGVFGQSVGPFGNQHTAAIAQQAAGFIDGVAGDRHLLLYYLLFHPPHGNDIAILQQGGKFLIAIVVFPQRDAVLLQQLRYGAAGHGAGGLAAIGHQCNRNSAADADPAVNQGGLPGGNGIIFLQCDSGTGKRLLGGIAAQRQGHTGLRPVGNVKNLDIFGHSPQRQTNRHCQPCCGKCPTSQQLPGAMEPCAELKFTHQISPLDQVRVALYRVFAALSNPVSFSCGKLTNYRASRLFPHSFSRR